MEHHNPLLKGGSKKFITVGEIMLRLSPPNYEKIRMANTFEANYGGSEANIALALANLGIDSTFFSDVTKPDNSMTWYYFDYEEFDSFLQPYGSPEADPE